MVTSLPVTRALLGQIAGWSRQLALVAAGLVAVHASGVQEGLVVRGALQGAAAWLWEVGVAVTPAEVADAVTADDRRLLQAIPTVHGPARVVPDGHESVAELCTGIAVSAERLRAAVFGAGQRARWAPATADAWRWTATAAAVTGHASDLLLRSLSGHPGRLGGLPLDGTYLRDANDAVALSWQAWRHVSGLWAGLTTEAQGRSSPLATEVGDLVLRMGRLVWDDPWWTPERGRGARLRAVADLATGGEGLMGVVAAIHQTADAFARAAAADRAAVAATDGAGHLYVRTRSLPEGYDVPRPYATPPADRTRPLLDAYQAAARASNHAARALAALALATNAPSSTLALARAAVASRLHRREEDQAPAASPAGGPGAGQPMPGPTEQAIRKLRVKDPVVLLRAAAIDTAAGALISQAERMSDQPGPRNNGVASVKRRLPSSGAARLAAQDHPHLPPNRASGAKNSAAMAASTRPGARLGRRPPRAPHQGQGHAPRPAGTA